MDVILIVLAMLCCGRAAGPSSSQIICSSFCRPTGCTGFTSSDCNDKCNSGTTWGWNPAGGPCELTTAGILFLDSSDDAGGMIAVSPNTYSTNCPGLVTYSGASAYGDYLATETVTTTLSGGTDIPHYQVDLIVDILLADPNSTTGNKQWPNSNMGVTINTSPAVSKNFPMSSPSTTYKGYCGDTNKNDAFYQLKLSFNHNLTNQDIIFTLKTNNNNAAATWVAKEFIYDIHTCNEACLSCNNTGTVNVCFSCDPSLGFMLNNFSCYNNCRTGYGYTEDPALCVWCDLHCTSCYGLYDNCSTCVTTTNSVWKSALYYNETDGYNVCVSNCPTGYFVNTTTNICELCDPVCLTCTKNETYCFSCLSGYGWTGYYCYNPCPS
jgi:hypothetical protein